MCWRLSRKKDCSTDRALNTEPLSDDNVRLWTFRKAVGQRHPRHPLPGVGVKLADGDIGPSVFTLHGWKPISVVGVPWWTWWTLMFLSSRGEMSWAMVGWKWTLTTLWPSKESRFKAGRGAVGIQIAMQSNLFLRTVAVAWKNTPGAISK